jgi:thymidylate synthase ThyX
MSNSNPKIFLYDEFNPEDNAMMQALYSRSPNSVELHAEKVRKSGSGKFMEKFYVGYGHSSIADCGSTTLYIENVSILADKVLQDWPMYSGQETSTRYVDMTKQAIIDPVGTPESKAILDDLMKFYIGSQEQVREHIKKNYPRNEGEKESVYEKAVQARSFDIMRGFLPAGITTQLSWHTNLRQAWDKIALLKYNPLQEARDAAKIMLEKLQEKYPNSFCHKQYEEQEEYRKFIGKNYYYNPENPPKEFTFSTDIKNEDLEKYKEFTDKRPQKTNLPTTMLDLGLNTFEFYLDYGSFRDIQRHRNGSCPMPLLTTKYGFNEWYLESLPEELQEEAKVLLENLKAKIEKLDTTKENLQYYIAMGYNSPCKVSYGLPASIYVTEMRAGKPVHPTLRAVAHQMHEAMRKTFPNLKLHADLAEDSWDVRRGMQDIVEKK